MELGAYTFAEVTSPDVTPQQRLRNLLEEIELAEQLGLDVFGVGEHHRPDFAVSSPAVVLAAAAERTQEIRLTSAVSVLSSGDPVPVLHGLATLDLLSRAAPPPRRRRGRLPAGAAGGAAPRAAPGAAALGLPMALAIIGGQPERF